MPKINEYEVKTSAQGAMPNVRRASTESFNPAAQLDTAIRSAGNATNFLLQRAEQQDISNLQVEFSKLHEQSVIDLQDQTQKGTLNTDEYMQRFDDRSAEIRSKVTTPAGQQFYDQQKALQHANNAISAIKAGQAQAGEIAVKNHLAARDTMSSTLMRNPSGFESAVAMNDNAIDAQVKTGGLPFDAAVNLKRQDVGQFAEASVRGWIKLNPEDAQKQLDGGKWDAYLGQDLKKQLSGEAMMGIHARREEKDRLERENKKLVELKQEATKNDFVKEFSSGKTISAEDIANSNLESQDKLHYIAINKRIDDDKQSAAYGANYQSVLARIYATEDDPNKLSNVRELEEMAAKGKLTFTDFKSLRDELQGKKTPQGQQESILKADMEKIAKGVLNPGSNDLTGIQDPDGAVRMSAWHSFYNQELAKQMQAGKTATQLLTAPSFGHPNPDWLGHNLNRFSAFSMQEQFQSMHKEYNRTVPGLIIPGNIDSPNLSQTTTIKPDPNRDEVLLVPSMSSDGRALSTEQAQEEYNKTGQNLGKFKNAEAATAYAQKLFTDQEKKEKIKRQPGETPAQYLKRMKDKE